MATLPESVDYTDKDFDALQARLIALIKSVMALAKMLGYRLHGAQAATAEVWLQLARVPVASVTIPAGTVLRTQEVTEPVRFQRTSSPGHVVPGSPPASNLFSGAPAPLLGVLPAHTQRLIH